MKLKDLFNKPKIIGLVANVNEGKSNTIYYIIDELKKAGSFSLYTYGLKSKIPKAKQIHSVNEMERVKDSVLVVDEMFSLFDLDNRKTRKLIENTLRLLNHNNNILLLAGVGENFKKFLSSKIDYMIYKRVTFDDLINGSRVKNIIKGYKGVEAGSTLLDLEIDEALIYDGLHYEVIHIPYMKAYDSKINNKQIIRSEKVSKKDTKSVPKKVLK